MTNKLLLLLTAFLLSAGLDLHSQDGYWSDYAATSFAGGTGTEADPYQIGTAEQLAFLAKQVNNGTTYTGGYFELTADIDLSAHNWVPIGKSSFNDFQGYFDGKEYEISDLYVGMNETDTYQYTGLFGIISIMNIDVTIQNITIASGIIKGEGNTADILQRSYIGSVIGYATNNASGTSSINISNCTNHAEIIGRGTTNFYTGGIIGYSLARSLNGIMTDTGLNTMNISNCVNYGKITVERLVDLYYDTSFYAGGIIGYVEGSGNYADFTYGFGVANIIDCINYGQIIVGETRKSYTGGIIGYGYASSPAYPNDNSFSLTSAVNVSNCENYAELINVATAESCTGGIIGLGTNRGTDIASSMNISNCINHAKIVDKSTTKSYVGGIIGAGRDSSRDYYGSENTLSVIKITTSYNSGIIQASGGYAGGLAGYFELTGSLISAIDLTQSYTRTSIYGTEESNKPEYAGGLVGGISSVSEATCEIDSCLVLIDSIAGETTHRIVGLLQGPKDEEDYFGIKGNYAWQKGNTTSFSYPKTVDGADWDGKMVSTPISLWNAEVWNIDQTNQFMPTLKSIDTALQPQIENPLWNETPEGIENKLAYNSIYGGIGSIIVKDVAAGNEIEIYTLAGKLVYTAMLQHTETVISIKAGIYIMKLNDNNIKVVVR